MLTSLLPESRSPFYSRCSAEYRKRSSYVLSTGSRELWGFNPTRKEGSFWKWQINSSGRGLQPSAHPRVSNKLSDVLKRSCDLDAAGVVNRTNEILFQLLWWLECPWLLRAILMHGFNQNGKGHFSNTLALLQKVWKCTNKCFRKRIRG